jgi:hypothetical protein
MSGEESTPTMRASALAQDLGRIARAAPNVRGGLDMRERNSLNEVAHGPSPLLLEFDILSGGPSHLEASSGRRFHATPSLTPQGRAGLAFVVNGRLTFASGE